MLTIALVGDRVVSVPPLAAPSPAVLSINPDDWQSLAGAIRERANGFGGDLGYVIKDFSSGQVAEINSAEAFPSASLIKFPILCAAFQAVEDRRFALSTPVTLMRSDKRG